MKITKNILIVTTAILSTVFLSMPVIAFAKQAQNGNNDSSSQNGSINNSGQNKLEGDNLKNCQSRETEINNIMARITNRGEKQLLLLDATATRLQTFYNNNNYKLNNYDELINQINTTRVEAQNTVQTMTRNNTSFNCGSDDPKSTANSFKERVRLQSNALDGYKTAIKNLLSNIKEAINNASEVNE
ncbi:MAG: hypothetical protein PWQ10_527 [Patescibacteria group bacterium]|nr:hypothetical protein [Patescibacteria group bacterium]